MTENVDSVVDLTVRPGPAAKGTAGGLKPSSAAGGVGGDKRTCLSISRSRRRVINPIVGGAEINTEKMCTGQRERKSNRVVPPGSHYVVVGGTWDNPR